MSVCLFDGSRDDAYQSIAGDEEIVTRPPPSLLHFSRRKNIAIWSDNGDWLSGASDSSQILEEVALIALEVGLMQCGKLRAGVDALVAESIGEIVAESE